MVADLLFVDGQIVTVDRVSRVAEALATFRDKILAVGSRDDLGSLVGPDTRIIELNGQAVLPGFIDSHAHLVSHGFQRMGVNCSYPSVKSIQDIRERIRKAAESTPKGQWVRGWLYNENYLEEGRHPTKFDLDEAAPDHPVFLGRICFHISVLNNKALELAGITRDTHDPKGGRIGRDEHGEPNGIMYETANFVARRVSLPTPAELRESLRIAMRDFLEHGVTTVHDAWGLGREQIRALLEFKRNGELKLRVNYMVASVAEDKEFSEYCEDVGISTGFGDSRLRLGPVKRIVDGDATAATAGMSRSYRGKPDDTGFLYYSQDELNELFLRSHQAGFQLTAHASGDRAVDMTLKAIENAIGKAAKLDCRPRIEHCAILDQELIRRIKELNVVPVPQPIFFYDFGDAFLRDYADHTHYIFPCRSLMENGIRVAASSDCPVASLDPILGMYEAMTRVTRSGQIVAPEECVTLDQAISMYTINGAYASFEESIKGSLEPGKLADLTVLSGPIVGLSPNELKELKVKMTVVGGEIVYDRFG